MDATAVSVGGFALFTVCLWIGIILWAISIGRKVYLDAIKKDEDEQSPGPYTVFQSSKWRIVVWFIALVVVVLFTVNSAAYRPKTVINPRNQELKERLQQIDESPTPVIKPSMSLVPEMDYQKAIDKNRESNKKAREEFMNLPDAK